MKSRNLQNASSNMYSCPNAQSYAGSLVGAQIYDDKQRSFIMNDYLRAYHPGAYATNVTVVSGVPDAFAAGISQTQVPAPADLILLYEGAQNAGINATSTGAQTNRNGSPYHRRTAGTSTRTGATIGFPIGMHSSNRQANFLFVDGHVKGTPAGATWTADTNPQLQTINLESWNGICTSHLDGYQCGSGKVDLWNPQLSGVVYP